MKTRVIRISQESFLKLEVMADELGQERSKLLDTAVSLLFRLHQKGRLPNLKRKRWKIRIN